VVMLTVLRATIILKRSMSVIFALAAFLAMPCAHDVAFHFPVMSAAL